MLVLNSKQPYLMDGNGETTPVSRLSCPRPLRQGLHVAGASLLLEESCRYGVLSGGSLVDFLYHLVYLLAYQPLVSLNKALLSPWKIHGNGLKRVVATQICFGICIPILGEMIQFDEHIFQMGWFNHQLVSQFIIFSTFGLIWWCHVDISVYPYWIIKLM